MSASRWFARLFRRRTTAPSTQGRVLVVPPSAVSGLGGTEPARSAWRQPWVGHAEEGAEAEVLAQARHDFCAALDGLSGAASRDLLLRAAHVSSLRELWHLRAELYSLIACERSQAEADRRLALVNRHFPARLSGHASTNEHHAHPSLFF